MVTISYFVGRIIPLPQLVQIIAQFGIFALVLVIGWITVPLFWQKNKNQKA